MDSPVPNQGKVKSLILLLRKITRIVQLVPFAFLAVYVIVLLIWCFIPDRVESMIETALYVSPAMTITMLFLSKHLKLCKYHKIACSLPTSTQILDAIDNYVITFTWTELVILYSLFGAFCILFLYQSHKIFFGNGRKEAVA